MTIILAPLIAALVTLTLIGCSDVSKKDQRRAKVAATDLALRSAVVDMAKRSNADLSWMAAIASDRASPLRPLYSVDLEKLWLIDRPIVFVGELANVATENNVDYRLIIKHSDFLSPELQLQLLCAKIQVTPVLDRVKADKESLTAGGVAVAARIARIGYATEPETEGTKVVFSGHGRCVEIAYLGDASQLMFFMQDAAKK